MNFHIYYNLKYLILLACTVYSTTGLSQSLISDGGFDIFWGIPSKSGQSYLLKHWNNYNTNAFPISVFYSYNNKGLKPLNSGKVIQTSHSGNGFVGIGYDIRNNQNSQFLATRLLKPLIKDSIYKVEMWVSLADNVKMGVDKIMCNFLITESQKINFSDSLSIYLYSKKYEYLYDKDKWMLITGNYKAKGGENYLVIGGLNNAKIKKSKFNFSFTYLFSKRYTYYFIDDVKITPIFDFQHINDLNESETDTQFSNLNYSSKDSVFNIFFEINDAAINDNNSHILYKIIENLKCVDEIQICGYADTTGSYVYNLKLAEERAKNILTFFYRNNIDESRLKVSAKGEMKNGLTNSYNRRVEIQIIRK